MRRPRIRGRHSGPLCLLLVFLVLAIAGCVASSPPTPASKVKRKRILIVSLGVVGHAVPMARIGAELVSQCCLRNGDCVVDFASHAVARPWWQEETVAVKDSFCLGKFISLGSLNETWYDKLARISLDPSLFRGTLTVFQDLYLESIPGIYDAINEPMRGADLAFVDVGTMGAVEKARALNVSLIIHSPTVWADTFGQFEPPHWLPAFGSGLSKDMTLSERCLNALLPRLLSVALQPALMRVNKMRYDAGLRPYFSSHEVFQDVRIVSSTTMGFEYPRLVPQLHAYVGPILPKRAKPHTFPRHIQAFLNKNLNRSLIIARFTSSINLDLPSLFSFKKGLEWFASMENVSVIWFSTANSLKKLKSKSSRFLFLSRYNVDTHLALLREASTTLSISSCGMAAVQEPIFCGVPVLCVPLVADQADVAARLTDSGAGLVLLKEDVGADAVLFALHMIKKDRAAIMAKVKTMRQLMKLAGGRERAALHVLSSLSSKDEDFLKLKRSLSWHKRVGLDVSAVVVSSVIFVATSIVLVSRWQRSRSIGF